VSPEPLHEITECYNITSVDHYDVNAAARSLSRLTKAV